MIQFLNDSNCQGLPPGAVASSSLFERNSLISRLMLARGCVKVICAPAMMGKTSLAYQFAEAARSFNRVFWIDALHPRFLRGLYDGELEHSFKVAIPDGSMVVFEDLPRMTPIENERFCAACITLLGRGVEVVVTCACAANPFAPDHPQVLLITSEDLLYSDEELAQLRSRGYLPAGYQGTPSRFERIAGLMNCPAGNVGRFLLAHQLEADDSFQRLLTFAMLLLGGGTLQDLSRVLGTQVSAEDLKVETFRPYAVLSDFGEGFHCDCFPLGDLLQFTRDQLFRACGAQARPDADALVSRVADLLLDRREVDRATRIMAEACGPAMRHEWVGRSIGRIFDLSAPVNALLLLRSLDPKVVESDRRLRFWEALAYLLLDEPRLAFGRFGQLAADPAADLALRLKAASCACLCTTVHPSSLDFGEKLGLDCLTMRRQGAPSPLVRFWNAILEGDSGAAELKGASDAGVRTGEWALAVACCLRAACIQRGRGELSSQDAKAIAQLMPQVGEVMEQCVTAREGELSAFMLRREVDAFGAGPHLSRAAISCLDQLCARMRVQRSSYGRLASSPAWERGVLARHHRQEPPRLCAAPAQPMSVPLLEVRMFGRFEVLIGGQPLERDLLTRVKARSLLSLLAIEPGKDFSCERLGLVLWPESTEEKARRNFYSIFSILKRSLTLEDGSCPYLSRTQGICRLSAPYLRTDAGEISDLCQRIRHGELGGDDAAVLLERIRGAYRGELLPGERVVSAVESARRTWRAKVVDSLVAASCRLREAGAFSEALDYASFALECDPQREDACEEVMIMQHVMKQRAGAIETFFAYQAVTRELGLDPSARMRELYDMIISDDDGFDDLRRRA